jgi:hypothetical protein
MLGRVVVKGLVVGSAVTGLIVSIIVGFIVAGLIVFGLLVGTCRLPLTLHGAKGLQACFCTGTTTALGLRPLLQMIEPTYFLSSLTLKDKCHKPVWKGSRCGSWPRSTAHSSPCKNQKRSIRIYIPGSSRCVIDCSETGSIIQRERERERDENEKGSVPEFSWLHDLGSILTG